MATAARRIGAESSATRAAILAAAAELIAELGYGSVSTRKVAARAGLKPSLVHYYFPTTDDLLLALSKSGAEESDRMIEQALASPDPLRALWGFLTDTSRTALSLEFMAMANHREPLRAHMAEHCEAMRRREVETFSRLLGDRLDKELGIPPTVLSLILTGIGRMLIMEGALGVTEGHAEARAYVENLLDRLAPDQGGKGQG